MSPVREPHRVTTAARVAAIALALAGAVAACAGGGSPGTGPNPGALPTVTSTAGSAAGEGPAVTPTRASTGLETPLPTSAHKAAVLLAAAATGAATDPPVPTPGVECVYFVWAAGAPPLPAGVAFVVDHAQVSPSRWKTSKLDCGGTRCVGAALTADHGSCSLAFARKDGPQATGATGSVVRLLGTVRCGAPATRADCAAFRAALVAAAATSGGGLPLDRDGSENGTGSTDDSGSTAGTGDAGDTGDSPPAVTPSSGG